MSKEKQIIEQLEKDIRLNLAVTPNPKEERTHQVARLLVKDGYRKQSRPFSCGHEKGGEWVQLPCKVGDTIYVISQMQDKRFLPFIKEYEVTSISIRKKSVVIWHEMDGYIKNFKQTDFGKTIFLTEEEAEAKMKGGE